MITIDDFSKIEIRVGQVLEASNQEGSEKLIRLKVDFGNEDIRTIFTGVRSFGYTPDYFKDKKWLFVTNLEPKKIMGEESQGMILAVDGADERPVFVIPASEVAVGAKLR
jgi:methionine--tRNA ligase beta chain